MSAEYFAIKHSSIQTPFWESLAITPNLKYAIAQAFPDDDVPEPSMSAAVATETGDALNHSKLLCLHALGMICAELREWEEAEKVFNKLIAESNKAFGPDSKPAAGAVSNLGNVYVQLGKYQEAEATIRKSKIWAGKNLGEESPQYLGAVRGLIAVLEKEGKFGEAEERLQEGLAIVQRMGGPFKWEETEEMQAIAENFKGLKK